jgi:hypothetical protein
MHVMKRNFRPVKKNFRENQTTLVTQDIGRRHNTENEKDEQHVPHHKCYVPF